MIIKRDIQIHNPIDKEYKVYKMEHDCMDSCPYIFDKYPCVFIKTKTVIEKDNIFGNYTSEEYKCSWQRQQTKGCKHE